MDMERLREIIGEPDQGNGAPEATVETSSPPAGSATTVTRAGERTVQDIYCHKLHEVRIGWLGCATVLLATVIIGTFIGATSQYYPNLPPIVRGLIAGIPVAGLIALIYRIGRGSEAKQIDKLLSSSNGANPISTIIAIKTEYYFSHDNRIMSRVISHFISMGYAGSVIRLWKKSRPAPVEPLRVQFEPLLVNEADMQFRELSSHTESATPTSRLFSRTSTDHESRLPPALYRNIRLRGGYFMLAMGLFNLIFPIIESLQRGRPTFMLFFWCAWIAVMFLLPAANSKNFKQQWLIVPGGLVSRQPSKRGKIDLYVFDAARCMLLGATTKNKLWTVTVSDGQSTGWMRVTPFEMDLILRAWCSPIKPPTVEQLSDFA